MCIYGRRAISDDQCCHRNQKNLGSGYHCSAGASRGSSPSASPTANSRRLPQNFRREYIPSNSRTSSHEHPSSTFCCIIRKLISSTVVRTPYVSETRLGVSYQCRTVPSQSDLITKSSKSLYHDRRLGIPRALKGEAASGDFSSLRNCASLGPVKEPTFRSRLVSERKPMELLTKRHNLW